MTRLTMEDAVKLIWLPFAYVVPIKQKELDAAGALVSSTGRPLNLNAWLLSSFLQLEWETS